MSDRQDETEQGDFKRMDSILSGLFAPDMLPVAPAKNKALKSKTTPSPSEKLVRASVEIHERPDETEAAYMARELVQCTLPHRDPKVDFWVRQNGNLSLILQSSIDENTLKPMGLPYGSTPRLILLWIVTEAVRTKSRNIKLGNTLNSFLRDIGLDPNTGGGKFSHAKTVKEQMHRLLHCRISFRYNEGNAQKGRKAFLNMEVAREGQFWWDYKAPDQTAIFESEIVLGEVFFEAITAAPVPLDLRALIPLKQSPLAIDLYTWATYRIFTMRRKGDAQITVSLADLKAQFGSEYTRDRDFKAAFVEAMTKVQHVFPALDYSIQNNALVLRDRKHRPAIAPTVKEPAISETSSIDLVSDKTRAWFKSQFPRMDVDAAVNDFYSWRKDREQPSMNTDRHFKAFAKTWEQRNR